ncbi:PREDICTED: dihydropyrimidinase isoform X2 [Nicrophorus vespilloides]|uniref:dihydropyrimidinase n=1 Tax=Nicrophorus vespilloides TaxID=110193 RepID=A0ABM1NF99_NICVS|nr:PREDICTED: dihydropyrimidinase isoform X2 [Nicrophorus vespilloides]
MSTPVKKVPIHLQSAQNRLLIKNGKTVNENEIVEQDVYVEDGIIKQLGRNLLIPGGTRVIDARGKYVIPGGIDPHTHMQFEFMGTTSVDDFYQGTKAAVAGGTTMIIDFVVPKQGESILDSYYAWRQKADDKVCCDYGLHVALTSWNDKVKGEMKTLCEKHGVNSFKMFMAYDFYLKDDELYGAFQRCRELGALAQVHAENGLIIKKNVEKLKAFGVTGPEGHEMSRPECIEAEAVNRACVISKQVNAAICFDNISTGQSAEMIKKHQTPGATIYGTTLVSNLALVGDSQNMKTITSPPLRSNPDIPDQIWGYLASDVLQLTGSDHCTFTREQKEMGKGDFSKIPNGVNGVEDRMSVIWEKGVHSGIIDPCRYVAITSTNAAKLFNVYPRKGCIAVGSDADIVVWNPSKTRVISSKTHNIAIDFNIFEGMECHGVPEYVIVNGRVCVDEEQLRAVQGHGKFVETPCWAPFIYAPEKMDELTAPKNNGALNEIELTNKLAKIELEPKLCITPTLPDSAISTPSCRGPRPEGQRNIQDSTFSISEELDVERKSCIKVKNPPGGKSSGFW